VDKEYTIIPVNTENFISSKDYWEKYIKSKDIVPTYNNFDIYENRLPYAGCFGDINWELPPSLNIIEIPDIPDQPNQQMFLYYDFGKPFLLYHEENQGACGWELAPYIKSLNNLGTYQNN